MAAIDPAEKRRLFERLSSVREIVFGVQDGVQTTAGVLCGLSGAVSQHSQVVLAALASTAAGALSMAAGAYLGTRAETEVMSAELEVVRVEAAAKPYMLIAAPRYDLGSALAATALTLFGVGYFEGWLAHRDDRWRSGIRFLAIAMSAAAAGYLIGLAISPLGATAG